MIACLAYFFSFACNEVVYGQAIGVEVVVDTAFYGPNTPTPSDTFDPEGILDGYVSYLVYAVMTNPTDVLSAVLRDNAVLTDGGPLVINSECGCYNPTDGTVVELSNSAIWQAFPLWEYDTFLDNWEAELRHARRQSFLDV